MIKEDGEKGKESTSDGNSAQRRSQMKMAFRYMKCRRLLSTESMSMASITSMPARTTQRQRWKMEDGRDGYGETALPTLRRKREPERESFSGLGLLGSNSKFGAARGPLQFKNIMSREIDTATNTGANSLISLHFFSLPAIFSKSSFFS